MYRQFPLFFSVHCVMMFFAECPLEIIDVILSFFTGPVSHVIYFIRCNKQLYDRVLKGRLLWKWWNAKTHGSGKIKLFMEIIPSVFSEVMNKRDQLLIGAELVFHSRLSSLFTDKIQNQKSSFSVRLTYNACEYVFCDVLGWEKNPYMDRVEWETNLIKFEIIEFSKGSVGVRIMIKWDGSSDWKQSDVVYGDNLQHLMQNLLTHFDMCKPAEFNLVERLCGKDVNMNTIRFYRPLDDVCSDAFKDFNKSFPLLTTKIFPKLSSLNMLKGKQEILDNIATAMIHLGNFHPYGRLFDYVSIIQFHMDRRSFPYDLEVLKELMVIKSLALSSIILKDEYSNLICVK